ncbi:hypothetical protein Ancab_013690 [Ancistrocladus abbreviatus]
MEEGEGVWGLFVSKIVILIVSILFSRLLRPLYIPLIRVALRVIYSVVFQSLRLLSSFSLLISPQLAPPPVCFCGTFPFLSLSFDLYPSGCCGAV